MYCEKCNKYFSKNDKFCDLCGEKLVEKELRANKKNSKKSSGLIICLIVLGVVLIIGSTVFFVASFMNFIDKMGKIEYIELDNDKIPTIYICDENIMIDEYNKNTVNGEIEVEVTYYDNLFNSTAIYEYIELLEENGFTIYTDGYNEIIGYGLSRWNLVKESLDGKVIYITIEINNYDESDITYEKINDSIDNYIKKITYQRVGEEKFGYINIDDTWSDYLEDTNFIQYSGASGSLYLTYTDLGDNNINLREYVDSEFDILVNSGVEIETEEVTVDGYEAYQLAGYYDDLNCYLAIWYFADDDNILHYIELDAYAYDEKDEIFSKIESYSVTK